MSYALLVSTNKLAREWVYSRGGAWHVPSLVPRPSGFQQNPWASLNHVHDYELEITVFIAIEKYMQ